MLSIVSYVYGPSVCPPWRNVYSGALLFFKKDFIYLFLERGREGERKGVKHRCVVACHAPATGDLAHNPGMCPDWESNWRPFGSQSSAQSRVAPARALPIF